MMQGFETARLRMRPLDARDEALYCALYTDPDTMRFICPPLSSERAKRTFRKSTMLPRPNSGPFLFAMVRKDTAHAIGICAVVQVNARYGRAEIGMMLHAAARNAQFATEALHSLAKITFAVFPIDYVWVQYAPAHLAAERLVVKLGFEPWDKTKVDESRAANCIWVVSRSWVSCNITNEGNGNVERLEFS
jgi:RimJ/RimL family protein N-acetyltransferase